MAAAAAVTSREALRAASAAFSPCGGTSCSMQEKAFLSPYGDGHSLVGASYVQHANTHEFRHVLQVFQGVLLTQRLARRNSSVPSLSSITQCTLKYAAALATSTPSHASSAASGAKAAMPSHSHCGGCATMPMLPCIFSIIASF